MQFASLRTDYDARFEASKDAIQTANAERKAYNATMNEWRATLEGVIDKMLPMDAYRREHEALGRRFDSAQLLVTNHIVDVGKMLSDRFTSLETIRLGEYDKRLTIIEGRREGSASMILQLVAIGGLALGLLNAVLAHFMTLK